MSLAKSDSNVQLALEGGERAVRRPLPPMFPGGMRIGAEEEQAVLEVLRTKRLFRYYGPADGPSKVAELEDVVAGLLGVNHGIAVGSGTAALTAGLAALGVGPGDEVIVPAYTWIATAAAVLAVGAVPVLAEVDDSLNLDAEDLEVRITPRTRAVIVVHMRGAPANVEGVLEVARAHDLGVVEDVAQAFGASYKGSRLGTFGDLGAFSFQFNKILTAGEGGLVVANDRHLFERALMYHDVASGRADLQTEETFVGTTCRLSELQAAVLLAQMGKLDGILSDMRRSRDRLVERIAGVAMEQGVSLRHQWDPAGDAAICVVLYLRTAEQADYVSRALRAEGAGSSVLFSPDRLDYHIAFHWVPLIARRSWSRVTPWDQLSPKASFDPRSCPRTLDLLGRAVHLDISPEYDDEMVDEIGYGLEKVLTSLERKG